MLFNPERAHGFAIAEITENGLIRILWPEVEEKLHRDPTPAIGAVTKRSPLDGWHYWSVMRLKYQPNTKPHGDQVVIHGVNIQYRSLDHFRSVYRKR